MSVNVTLNGQLMFPSKYIGAADLKNRDVNLTIAKVQVDDLQMVGGRHQKKPVLYFAKTEKMMVLNKTNAITIAGMHGAEMKSWVGKSITVFPTTTRCGGGMVDCVRVREVVPVQQQPARQATADSVPSPEEQANIAAQEAAESRR